MKHIILAVYILLGSTGLAGLAALLFLKLRIRLLSPNPSGGGILSDSRLVMRFFVLYLLMFLGLALTVAWYYGMNIIESPGKTPSVWIGTLGGLNMTLLYLAVFRLFRGMPAPGRKGRVLENAGKYLSLFTALIVFLNTLNYSLAVDSPFLGRILKLSGYPLTTLTVLLMGAYCLSYPYGTRHSSVRLLGRATGIAALTYLPLTIAEMILDQSVLQPYHPLSLDFLFYLELNLSALAAFYRSLTHQGPAVPVHSGVSDQAAAFFSLTGREQEMVSLIARGLANKEIGAELGISAATVRTHIYNLYQKVGARSRIELLNRVNSYRE